tara:strand:- start:7 stop:528 length:522 start_codon:yes stop_codon:yes gene_type:complete
MNPRAELLRSSTWQYQRSYQRSYNRKQQRQERSKPTALPTHSISRIYTIPSTKTQEPKPVEYKQPQRKAVTDEERKSGNRFALFHGDPPEYVAVTEPYIAFCNEKSWDEGWRPGFLLGTPRSPPEKYSDAKKMYEIYKKTGNLVYPYSGKKPVDKVKTTANEYQYRNTSVKKK